MSFIGSKNKYVLKNGFLANFMDKINISETHVRELIKIFDKLKKEYQLKKGKETAHLEELSFLSEDVKLFCYYGQCFIYLEQLDKIFAHFFKGTKFKYLGEKDLLSFFIYNTIESICGSNDKTKVMNLNQFTEDELQLFQEKVLLIRQDDEALNEYVEQNLKSKENNLCNWSFDGFGGSIDLDLDIWNEEVIEEAVKKVKEGSEKTSLDKELQINLPNYDYIYNENKKNNTSTSTTNYDYVDMNLFESKFINENLENYKYKEGTEGRKRSKPNLLNLESSERPFVCTQGDCNRAFKRLEHLKRHHRIHTGERPFKCHVKGCFKSFARSDNLAQHLRIHNTSMNYKYENPMDASYFMNSKKSYHEK